MIDLHSKDREQRQQALDTHHSFIVQAPAGSGKTELLIQRFLSLLTIVNTPEEILAITFTKKAASEMRARIINALKQAQEVEPEPAHAKQTWRIARQVLQRDTQRQWNLNENPNQLRIQTIDSLCAYLTKQLPLLANFGAQLEINTTPELLYSEAVQEVLSHVEATYDWSPSLIKLLLHLDNDLNRLHDLLVIMLAKRDQWLPYIHFNSDPVVIREHLEQHLANVISEQLSTLKTIFPTNSLTELMAIARFAMSHLPFQQAQQFDLNQIPGHSPSALSIWKYLATLLLTRDFSWRKRFSAEIGFPALSQFKNHSEKQQHNEMRARLTTLINELSSLEELRIALAELFTLPNPCYSDTQWEILYHLLQVLKIVAAQLRVIFQLKGNVDFIENTQAALLALGDEQHPTDLALALDYQIRHILVDEFQDTSFTQFQLIEKLIAGWEPGDGRTLFIVGDPMQSIYRFREAEVGLFLRLREQGIGHIKLTPLTLAVNFRSQAEIIQWNNAFFKTIFPKINNVAMGAVSFTESDPADSNSISFVSHTTLKGFVNTDDTLQAKHIVETIAQIQQHHPDDSIAILVRSRTHLLHIVPALTKAKINFLARDINALSSRQCVQDVFALTCALLFPADRISWLAVLRAPWCGLSLADLHVLAGNDPYALINERLDPALFPSLLSADGCVRLQRVGPILTNQIKERGRQSIRQWVEETWMLLGGPATLNELPDSEDVNAYFDLLATMEESAFSLSLEQLQNKMNELYASSVHRCNLQLMTIHAAKGLEFDHVMIPHLERKMPVDDKPLLSWMEYPLAQSQSVALLLAPIHAIGHDKDPIYEFIHKQLRAKSAFEIDRLFYVAATRAKKQLYLLFNIKRNPENKVELDSGSFLQKMWPFVEKNLLNEPTPILHEENIVADSTPIQRMLIRLKSTWKNPVVRPENKLSVHQKSLGFKLEDRSAALIGTLSHYILQQIATHGMPWWLQQSQLEQEQYISRHLKRLGMMMEKLSKSVTMAAKIIHNAVNDQRGQWILFPHAEARSELALTTQSNENSTLEVTEKIVIDRTFIDEAGIRWIIDYKTTALTQTDVMTFLKKEKEKYLAQMQKYASAFQYLEKGKTIHLGLYFPALPAWQEWPLFD